MKIPTKAKKVFTGIVFDVYQWKQKLFDGSVQTYEGLKRDNTVKVICTQGNKILLAYEMQPGGKWHYGMLGGMQEGNEKPLATAKRELLEESGMVSSRWSVYKEFQPLSKLDWSVWIFIARECKVVQKRQLQPGEKIVIKAVTFEQFVEIVVSEKFFGRELSLDVLRLERAGKLRVLKKAIFGK